MGRNARLAAGYRLFRLFCAVRPVREKRRITANRGFQVTVALPERHKPLFKLVFAESSLLEPLAEVNPSPSVETDLFEIELVEQTAHVLGDVP
jgi:hypothetical protein